MIGLSAAFSVDGEVVKSSDSVGSMGVELQETLALWSPAFGWDEAVNYPTAGEYRAIGLDLQGGNPGEAAQLEADVAATQGILGSDDPAQLATLTKNQIWGDLRQCPELSAI